ncbi:MAG: RnfABCDGE type electron transport complex subunit A [Elusimicrobia bacterium]|nr:RnfABCDGE type electron transport complex subunit A [Elusimicrobiota bacterium]
MIDNSMTPGMIFLSASLINNIILMQFLGLCSFFGVSTNIKNSASMGLAVTFVAVMAGVVSWAVYHLVLVPFQITFLRTAVFVLTIASLVQLEEMFIKKYVPPLYSAMGIYLPLITTNCAILAVAFLNIDYSLSLLNTVVHSFAVAFGYVIAIVLFAGLREHLVLAPVPKSLRGYPLAFFLASLMSLAFMGFKGLFGL